MTKRFEPKVERMREALERGIGSGDVRAELGLPLDSDDRDVAWSLVQILSACDLAALGVDELSDPRILAPEPSEASSSKPGADTSFMGRLDAAGKNSVQIGALDDVRTLLAVARGGSLRQRRAAIERLVTRLSEKTVPSDQARRAQAFLGSARDVELAYELAEARQTLSGAVGRKARHDKDTWSRQVDELVPAIEAFWEGTESEEPIFELPGDERLSLLLHVRDLPAAVVRHLSALLCGDDGVAKRTTRLACAALLRYGADPRLVPAFIALLDEGKPDLMAEATRALGRIDDPGVVVALARSYERSNLDVPRALLAGALAMHGDMRGAEYVRELLTSDDAATQIAALEALESLGAPEDSETVTELLETGTPKLVAQCILTLERIGDGRALHALESLREKTRVSALRADIEDAEAAILARMELRGEDVASIDLAEPAKVKKSRSSFGKRFRAYRYYLLGQMWLGLGALARGTKRLEASAKQRPEWGSPLISIALAHARRQNHSLALNAFRRAIEVDRERVERNPLVVQSMARCFLRRAEEVESDGRVDIARGLVGEVLMLDLRRASSALRYELERRHEALGRGLLSSDNGA